MSDVAELLKEIKETRDTIQKQDTARLAVIEELKAEAAKQSRTLTDTEAKLVRITDDLSVSAGKYQELVDSVNDMKKTLGRQGTGDVTGDEANRKAAVGLLQLKHELKIGKKDAEHPFTATEDQITEAAVAIKGMHSLINTTDIANLTPEHRKALSSFNFGSNGFILAPEMSSRILSCLIDKTDVAGIMANMTIAGPSVKFLVDNVLIDSAAWACEASCFANNPQAHLQDGLGELEIKPETLRYILCASRDILEDASVDIEAWAFGKVQRAFRNTVSNALISGSGVGMPIGILNPAAGIPICNTGAGTPAGQFTWQDLVMLKWQVPMQYHTPSGGGKYLMNQNTFGQALTISDASGRPIMVASPLDAGQFLTSGAPVQIVTQMPDVAPGSTPIAFGNWEQTYMVVNRKAVTMQSDPYSAGFCVLFKFESRVGGAVICPLAARLLRIQ